MSLDHHEVRDSPTQYVPGEMSDELLTELREHLSAAESYTLPDAPTNPVIRAMQAGSLSRQAQKNAALEAVRFLLPRTADGTDALSLLKDLERRAGIPRHSGLVACHLLVKRGELIDEDHKFTLTPSAL